MANELHILAEIDNPNQVFAPLKSTNRIKYTCFNVSKNFIIFGATSGGLYVFKREPCTFLQLLPNKEGSVTQVSASPDEKFFAFATLKGLVCVLERTQSLKIRRIQMSVEHQGSEVTALQWNSASYELFVGDDSGKVSVVNVSPFMAKNMFQQPAFPLMQLDSRIVQLDWCSELLLVSTLSRCYICDTFKEQYRPIGQKLRDGEYGACFYTTENESDLTAWPKMKETTISGAFSSLNEGEKLSGYEGVQNVKIFCARPGSRLWHVHIDGSVLSTHQFKHAFSIPPVEIITPYGNDQNGQTFNSGAAWCPQSFSFTKLFVIAKKFLFTFKQDGMCVLDPVKGDVVLWTNNFKDVIDVKILNDKIYVWTASGNFHSIGMLPLDTFLVKLHSRKQYALCAELCLQYNNYLLELAPSSSKLQLLADLGNKLGDTELSMKVTPLLKEITKYVQEKQNAQRLKCGIFLVGNTQFFWNEEKDSEGSGESLLSSQVQSSKVDGLAEKSRSLTASPESVRKKRNWAGQSQRRTGSTLSLPELEHSSVPSESCDNTQKLELNAKSSDSLTLSDSTFPPEAIQTFREFKQNFPWKIINTKSLKEKWQMLEDKMKLLNVETNPEPLDVRPVDYKETIEEEKHLVEDLELVHSSTATIKQKCPQFPAIDTSVCIELCKYFVENEKNADKSKILEFLDVFNYTNNLFVSAFMKDHCDIEGSGDTVQNSSYLNNLKTGINSFGPFPFSYYFSEEIVRVVRDHFHLAVNSGYLFTWLQVKAEELQHVPVDQFPEEFEAYCSRNMLKLDFLLSRILLIFSDILDPKLILHSIKREELGCYYLSLCIILDRYQEGKLHHVGQGSGHDNYEEMPLPVLLNTVFYMLSMERIDTCCKLGRQVCTKDVWYLVLRLQEHVEATGKDKEQARLHCYSLFLCYLEKMSATKDCLTELLTDDQLRSFVTSIFEKLNFVENGSCVCGYPLLNPPALPYPELAELMVVYYWENDQGHLLEMCKSVPSLWHLILPKKRSGAFGSVLPLMIHLGDAIELANWMPCMSCQDWERTLELLVLFRGGTCLNCGSTFTAPNDEAKGILWSSLGPLLVKGVGSQKALQLLSKYSSHIHPGELDERFFQTCIFSAIVDSHTDGLRNKVIDLFSEYTTKTTDTALFSPMIASSLEEALKEDLGRQVEFPLTAERHHWGVKIDLEDGNCPFCLLPLGSPVLMKDGGVTTFRCGHSFHVVCLRRRSYLYSCPSCTKNS